LIRIIPFAIIHYNLKYLTIRERGTLMQRRIHTIICVIFFASMMILPLRGEEVELSKTKAEGSIEIARVAPKVPEQIPTGNVPVGIISTGPVSVPLQARHIPLGFMPRELIENSNRHSENESASLLAETAPLSFLTEKAQLAIDIAPEWIKDDLEFAFPRLGSLQDDYADLIIQAPDKKYVDELAFMIAHTSDVEIKRMSTPDIFTENVKWIYENVKLLGFVELIDVGIPGEDADFYTTAKYHYRENNEEKEYTLPMEEYYWYVVHPKLNNENIKMDTEPSTQQATYGYWWREYLMYNPSEEYDYKKHKIFEEPNRYDIDHFNALSSPATGHITGWEHDPIMPLVDAETGGPVFIEQKDYNGAFTGCYMVTTLPVEKMYEDGESNFLENMLKRGYFNTPLPWLPVPGLKIVILKDVDPFGVPTNENILKALNYNVKVYGSDSFGKPEVLIKKPVPIKVIIASGQPRSFYEKLAEHKDWFLRWLQNANVLEFHAAIDPEMGDWRGLEFTLGVTFDDPYENQVTKFDFGYYPVLQDVISPATYIWDGGTFGHTNVWQEWYGNAFNDSDFAIQALGKWIAQIMQALVTTTEIPRSLQPNQIAMLKIGMCGEMQDITMGAFRSALIPIIAVNDHAEDHVWTELFFLDDWTFFEVWRGGMVSQMGKPAGVYDKSYGGKYDISGVWQWRGDGYTINVTDRYTPTCTFYAKVVDNNGYPVDGAMVEVWSNYVWGNYMQSVWSYTDENGECSMQVGDNRRFYGKVITEDAGTYPHESNRIELVAENTQAGMTYKWETPVINTEIPQLKAHELPSPENPMGKFKFEINYSVPYQILNAENPQDLNVFTEKLEGGIIDFFICDGDNFKKYKNGSDFDAYALHLRSTEGSVEFTTPDDNSYYIVFSNESKMVLKEEVYAQIDILQREGESWTPADHVEKSRLIPAGERWFFKLSESRYPPKITMAGLTPQFIYSDEGGKLEINVNIYGDAEKLELYYGGIPTGLKFEVKEGSNKINLNLGTSLPRGTYLIEMVASTNDGLMSNLWPYLEISGDDRYTTGFRDYINTYYTQEPIDPDAPRIIMAGFGDSEISESGGGNLEILAQVDDPQGLDDIKSVDIFLENGVPTGLSLSDSGNGLYYFSTAIPAGIPTGSYLIEVVAEDKSGNKSARFPYFTVY